MNPRTEARSHVTAIIISVFFGWLGFDRFYLGRYITGMIKSVMLVLPLGWWSLPYLLEFLSTPASVGPYIPTYSALEEYTIYPSFPTIIIAKLVAVAGIAYYLADIILISMRRLKPKNGEYLSGPPWHYW